MTKDRKSMDVDQLYGCNGNDAKSSNKNIEDPIPVSAGASGIGLPYAPEDWPHVGDNWSWKVGSRKAAAGHWMDRYISPPGYFPKVSGCRARFQSRLSLEQYIRKEFPDADVDAFFASFSWKVLAVCTRRAVDAALSWKEIISLDSPDNSRDSIPVEFAFDVAHSVLNGTNEGERQGPLYITSDHANMSAKLEDEVDDALHSLNKSQESEYRIAEEKLYSQKDILIGLYQQLEVERVELARQTPFANGGDSDALLTSVLSRVDQIKREEAKLKQMMGIAEGFARTPGIILREYFDISVDD